MNEWFKKLVSNLKEKWAKWSITQKVIAIGIVLAVVLAIVLGFRFSGGNTGVRILQTPVHEPDQSQILLRLDQDNIKAWTDSADYIYVNDEKTAIRSRTIIMNEGRLPAMADPFAGYYDRGWSTTDAEQNVKKQRAMKVAIEQHLEALDDISKANVELVLPPDKLFKNDQTPVKASVILTLSYGSDLASNRQKIKGVENLVLSAVDGLLKDNLFITDVSGIPLNDDTGMELATRLSLIEKEQKLVQKLENYYRAQVLQQLQGIKGTKRINDVSVKIDMNFSERHTESVHYRPFVRKEDNKDTSYDDSEIVDSVVGSSQTVTREWQGTGFNPQGPTGTEGNNPPVYDDMSNVIGRQIETGATQNFLVNTDNISEEYHPTIDRITVSVNVDGIWTKDLDDSGNIIFEKGRIKRTYQPVPKEELTEIADIVEGAIGYDKRRSYQVVVRNISVDHQEEFDAEDEKIRRERQTRMTIILVLIGFAAVLIVFILYRVISRELERRRRIKAEEERRRQEMARIMALQDAQNEGMEVTMSVEERRRAELQENAIAMAKEHPEDVAMLIRTWLMEE